MKNDLLFFTGAGFSAGFLKRQNDFLTTTALTKLFRDESYFIDAFDELKPICPGYAELYINHVNNEKKELLKIRQVGQDILDNLEIRDSNNPILIQSVNFETVFYLLEELVNYLPTNDDTMKSSKHDKRIPRFYLPSIFFSEVIPNYSNPNAINSTLLFALKKFFLDFTTLFHPENNSTMLLNDYFNKSIERSNLKYFTLNYDDLFLKSLQGNTSEEEFEDYFLKNFSCAYNKEEVWYSVKGFDFNRELNHNLVFQNTETIPHCYFHLHGSVRYSPPIDFYSFRFNLNNEQARKARKGIDNMISEPLPTGAVYDNSFLITGLDKDLKLNREPHSTILKRFFFDCYNSTEIVICGYSFQDEHINSILKHITNIPGKSIKIIDYKNSIEEKKKFIAWALNSLFEINVKDENGHGANDFWYRELPNIISDSPVLKFSLLGFRFEFCFNGLKDFIMNEISNTSYKFNAIKESSIS